MDNAPERLYSWGKLVAPRGSKESAEGMNEVDWVGLWRELSERLRRPEVAGEERRADRWRERAQGFDAAVKRKKERSDPLLDFVVGRLHQGDTALDIGAGTGSFAIPMARVARRVTAVEPSQSMAAILRENAAAQGLVNIDLVEARWEDTEVEPHDVAVCSHAMYSSPDLVGFVGKMERSARSTCFLLMRVPSHDGIIGEISRRIYGQPHDSPNFVVGYNVLHGMGIYANVMMEPVERFWADDSLDDALVRAKRHLRLGNGTAHDDTIRELLAQRLTFREGQYHWPDGMRSALVWWDTSRPGSPRP
ncbi:MAG: SAM-dependent methyltransferase [Dehalococcoidia bacterium]|nr:SAM-dependent methyltransferase [Dehalococcoidia bacterium]